MSRVESGTWGAVVNKLGPRFVGLDRGQKNIEADDKEVQLRQLYFQVECWHGTGRFQYRDREVVDVLGGILDSGGLVPRIDRWDPKIGEVQTISTSPSRMYARLYAGMHFCETANKNYLLGDTKRWVDYFLGITAMQVAREFGLYKYITPKRIWRQMVWEYDMTNLAVSWRKKVSQEDITLSELFIKGSDIEGNYPMLFGISSGAFDPIITSSSIARFEKRSKSPLLFKHGAITHVEVPLENIPETKAMLEQAKLDLSISPLQTGEDISRRMSFLELVGHRLDPTVVSVPG